MNRKYLLRKVSQACLTLVVMLVFNFILFRALPGDPIHTLLPRQAPPQVILETRERLGLDQPLIPNQLGAYFGSLARGEFGSSFLYRRPVPEVLAQRVGPTLLLVTLAQILALVLGVLIGLYAGWRAGGGFDRFSVGTAVVLWSAPVFWLAMISLVLASQFLPGVFPVAGGYSTPGVAATGVSHLVDVARHVALPALVLAASLLAQYALIMRSSIISVSREDYITTARAKGLSDERVLRHHAFPNALLPLVTVIGINVGVVLTGAVTLEVVFNWPGLGNLMLDAVEARDYPVLQAILLFVAVIVILANLVADILYGMLDPRVEG